MNETDLLWRWIEDPAQLDAAELAQLQQAMVAEPALAARARRHLQLAAGLGALAPAPAARRPRARRPPVPRPRRRPVTLLIGLVAAALLIALALPLMHRDPIVGRLANGQALRAGDLVEAGPTRLELQLETGDAVGIEPGSSVRIVAASAQDVRLALVAGTLRAEVVPRPQPRFAVATAHATARVLGTRFQLSTDAGGSELTVEHGRVAWSSPAGSVDVAAGRKAVARAGSQPTLQPLRRRWSFDDRTRPAAIVAGTVLDHHERGPCLRGEAYHEPTNSLGLLASDAAGVTRISAMDELTFRYRIDNGAGTSLCVWAQTADGAQWRLRMEPDLAPGWHSARVVLARLEGLEDPSRHPPEGALVLHLTIGINNGIGRAILLDDIEMSQP